MHPAMINAGPEDLAVTDVSGPEAPFVVLERLSRDGTGESVSYVLSFLELRRWRIGSHVPVSNAYHALSISDPFPSSSYEHAELELSSEGDLFVRDLNSRFGTSIEVSAPRASTTARNIQHETNSALDGFRVCGTANDGVSVDAEDDIRYHTRKTSGEGALQGSVDHGIPVELNGVFEHFQLGPTYIQVRVVTEAVKNFEHMDRERLRKNFCTVHFVSV